MAPDHCFKEGQARAQEVKIRYFQVTALEQVTSQQIQACVQVFSSYQNLLFTFVLGFLFVCLFFKVVIEYHQLNTTTVMADLSELSRGDISGRSRSVWLKFCLT